MEQLIISLVSGAVGGNLAGLLMKDKSLGTLGNSVAGIVGGGIGAQIMGMLGAGGMASGGMALNAIIGEVAAGGIGGGVLMVIIGLIKKAMSK